MDQEPSVIRHQIEETRCSLTDKLETLENQVLGTVANAKSSVQETIQSVKSTVNETVQKVKQTFDVSYQVERHPWAMFGGSVVAGFLAGTLFEKGANLAREQFSHMGRHTEPERFVPPPSSAAAFRSEMAGTPSSNGAQTGWLGRLLHQFDDEIQQAKELAIGAAVGVVRDLVKQAVPQLGEQIEELMDNATTKLGGKPVRQPLVEPQTSGGPWGRRGDL